IDPDKLIKHGLTFDEVVKRIREDSNFNVGGGSLRANTQSLLVHGQGRAAGVEELRAIALTARDGTAIKVGDVAEVAVGHGWGRGPALATASAGPCSASASC